MSLQALLWKDARRELRSKESLQTGLVLVGLFAVVYLFSGTSLEGRLAALALWIPLVFATAALTGRGLAAEADRGTLEWLRSLPVSPALHGVSRTLVDLVLAAGLTAATLLVLRYGFAVPVGAPLLLVAALGVWGLTVVGALTAGLAAQARSRELLLPILLVPAAAPLLQSGMAATLDALTGSIDRTPLLLMAGYDLVATGIAWLLWPFVLEADG